jgi:hypothetical protein
MSSIMPLPDHSIQWLTLFARGTSANMAPAWGPICCCCVVALPAGDALHKEHILCRFKSIIYMKVGLMIQDIESAEHTWRTCAAGP